MALLGNAYWASIEVKEFDVDEFINSVYQEFAGTEHEESREALRSLWNKVLSVTSPRGDASLYPNNNGAHRAAAMKVWHKAGDFWRAKYRQGDKLLCDQNGIALNQSDLACIAKAKCSTEEDHTEGVRPEPRELDLFAMQAENERLRAEIEQMKQERVQSVAVAQRHTRQPRTPRPSRQRQTSTAAVAIEQPLEEPDATKNVLRFLGVVVCMTLVLVLLWKTGLIIPLGVIGLGIGGFLK